MELTSSRIDNVTQIKMISANSTYGIGFLTTFISFFVMLFGIENAMYDKKIEKAKMSAAQKLVQKAKAVDATGVMDIKFLIHGTTVFMYGIAYK